MIHALVDAEGRPIRFLLTPGQANDAPAGLDLIGDLTPGAILIADRAYDTNAIRDHSAACGAWANVPPRTIRYDWDHIDPELHGPRPLQIDQALQCIDMRQGIIRPVTPTVETAMPVRRERVLDCAHFRAWHISSSESLDVGIDDAPTVLVCVQGGGAVQYGGRDFEMMKGAVLLLPAAAGSCRIRPDGPAELLEIVVPED